MLPHTFAKSILTESLYTLRRNAEHHFHWDTQEVQDAMVFTESKAPQVPSKFPRPYFTPGCLHSCKLLQVWHYCI